MYCQGWQGGEAREIGSMMGHGGLLQHLKSFLL